MLPDGKASIPSMSQADTAKRPVIRHDRSHRFPKRAIFLLDTGFQASLLDVHTISSGFKEQIKKNYVGLARRSDFERNNGGSNVHFRIVT